METVFFNSGFEKGGKFYIQIRCHVYSQSAPSQSFRGHLEVKFVTVAE